MNFSKRLKELREKNGLSQEALAEKLKIPRSSVTHYESGDEDRMPRQKRLNEIADFFGVNLDYLIGRADTSELKEEEKSFLHDVSDSGQPLTVEELKEKYELVIDGKPASKEEIEGAMAFIRSLRDMKK